MKKRILITFLSLFLVPCSLLFAQREASDVRKGNKQYNKQDYNAAEISYRRALETNKESYAAQYNLGEALFKQDKYPEALEAYENAARMLDKNNDKTQMAKVMHNIGNCHFALGQYDKAVAAFQESLRANPKDNDTRYNFVKAKEMLKQQQQQQQDQQNKDQKKEQQQQQQQQQQQEQQQNQDQKKEEQQQQQQQQQQQEQTMDQETAERILQALEQDEQDTQEKLQRIQGKKRRVEKEW
jgi:tetratricopeptide (TPR) repeat protein